MSRISSVALAGLTAAGLTATTLPSVQAAPFPAATSTQVVGAGGVIDHVGWRRGYYGPRYGYGYGYRRRNIGGALFAGAAFGLIGTAIAASAAPRYGYYDDAYARPVYGYPAYGYGGYGYPYGW